jgi:hypothetical protein
VCGKAHLKCGEDKDPITNSSEKKKFHLKEGLAFLSVAMAVELFLFYCKLNMMSFIS